MKSYSKLKSFIITFFLLSASVYAVVCLWSSTRGIMKQSVHQLYAQEQYKKIVDNCTITAYTSEDLCESALTANFNSINRAEDACITNVVKRVENNKVYFDTSLIINGHPYSMDTFQLIPVKGGYMLSEI